MSCIIFSNNIHRFIFEHSFVSLCSVARKYFEGPTQPKRKPTTLIDYLVLPNILVPQVSKMSNEATFGLLMWRTTQTQEVTFWLRKHWAEAQTRSDC